MCRSSFNLHKLFFVWICVILSVLSFRLIYLHSKRLKSRPKSFSTVKSAKAEPCDRFSEPISFGKNTAILRSTVKIPQMLEWFGVRFPSTPIDFKLVLDFVDLKDPYTRTRFFWTSEQKDCSRGDWVPASSVKIFAAYAALVRLSELGLGPDTYVQFLDRGRGATVHELVTKAIVSSDNMAYNRLVQLAGHHQIHEKYLKRYPNTELNKPYMSKEWGVFTGGNFSFASPEIVLAGTIRLPESAARVSKMCGGQQACSTLEDLNNFLYDVVYLTPSNLSDANLRLLRQALGAQKTSGQEFSNSILRAAGDLSLSVFGKHGFNGTTYCQSVLLYEPNLKKFVIVSAEGSPGDRRILNSVGSALGQLLQATFFN